MFFLCQAVSPLFFLFSCHIQLSKPPRSIAYMQKYSHSITRMIAVILPYNPLNPWNIVRYIEKMNEITCHPTAVKTAPGICSLTRTREFDS